MALFTGNRSNPNKYTFFVALFAHGRGTRTIKQRDYLVRVESDSKCRDKFELALVKRMESRNPMGVTNFRGYFEFRDMLLAAIGTTVRVKLQDMSMDAVVVSVVDNWPKEEVIPIKPENVAPGMDVGAESHAKKGSVMETVIFVSRGQWVYKCKYDEGACHYKRIDIDGKKSYCKVKQVSEKDISVLVVNATRAGDFVVVNQVSIPVLLS